MKIIMKNKNLIQILCRVREHDIDIQESYDAIYLLIEEEINKSISLESKIKAVHLNKKTC